MVEVDMPVKEGMRRPENVLEFKTWRDVVFEPAAMTVLVEEGRLGIELRGHQRSDSIADIEERWRLFGEGGVSISCSEFSTLTVESLNEELYLHLSSLGNSDRRDGKLATI